MVRNRPANSNESRENEIENLSDLESACRHVAGDSTDKSCSADAANRRLSVQPESEMGPPPSIPHRYLLTTRCEHRALVCASAVVMCKGKTTEHMTYDLSVAGVRLCGLPRGQVGDEVCVQLELPEAQVLTSGRLLRLGSITGELDCAIEFFDLSGSAEGAIHHAVDAALAHPDRRSLLLVQMEVETQRPRCFDWLNPLSPISSTARTSQEALRCLEGDCIEIGILGSPGDGAQDLNWNEVHTKVCWRSIDHAGRLHPLVTLQI